MSSSALANHARRFNGHVMPHLHEEWCARVLNMQRNPDINNGPDLFDKNKIVEVKFTLINPDKYTHKSWRVLDNQLIYGENQEAYWALGLYKLSHPVINIQTAEPEELEQLVTRRELFLVEWDWMKQFPAYRQTGKTKSGRYDNTIRFGKFSKLPRTIKTYEVDKGVVHLTENVSPSAFRIQTVDAPF